MKKILSIFLIIFFLCSNCVFASETTERLLGGVIVERVNKSSQELLYYVVHGELNNVKALLDKGESPNSTFMGVSSVFFAVYCNQPEILGVLLDYGARADDTCYGETILAFSVYRKNLDCIKVLIDKGANLNLKSNAYLPINVALSNKNFEIAKLLYDNGAILDKKSLKLMKKNKISFD